MVTTSRRVIRVAIVIGVVLGFMAVPMLGALIDSSSPPTSGTVPLNANNGAQVDVTGASNITMDSSTWPDDNTVYVQTNNGNATFTANGPANATIAAGNITGSSTTVTELDVTSNTLTIDPEDKPQIEISGDTDWLEYYEMTLDDGTTDFIYAGSSGTTTVTVRGVAANEEVGATDQNGNLLATATSDGNGKVTLSGMSNSQHNVNLISGSDPTVSDLAPTGNLSVEPSDLSVQVNDSDFNDGDTVTVTFTLDGTQIDQQTVSSNGTVTTSIPSSGKTGGTHSWSVDVEDDFGLTDSASASYAVPDTLFIKNVSAPTELINNSGNVSIRYLSDDTIIDRQTSDGSVDLTGNPSDEPITVEADVNGYHKRSIILENIYRQNDIYLLNTSKPSVTVRFTLQDKTSTFTADSSYVLVQRPLTTNGTTEWKTVAGDYFGVNGYTEELEDNTRYRLIVRNDAGDSRILGEYVTSQDEVVPLTIGQVSYSGELTEGVVFNAKLYEDSGSRFAELQYLDTAGATDSFTYKIVRADNESNVIVPSTTIQVTGEETVIVRNMTALDPNATEGTGYKVIWNSSRTGATDQSGNTLIGDVQQIVFDTLDPRVRQLLAWSFIVAFAGVTALFNPKLSMLTTPIVALAFSITGLLDLPSILVAVALVEGGLFYFGDTSPSV